MNGVTLDKGGVNVYRDHEHQYDKATELESQIHEQKKLIATDPNLSPNERKNLLSQLDKALSSADRAQALSSTTKLAGIADSKMDRNDKAIDNNLRTSNELLMSTIGQYTDAKKASDVAPPPPPASLCDDMDVSTKPTDVATKPPISSSQAFNEAMSGNPKDVAKRIMSGDINLSDADLRAMAASGGSQYRDIMSELNALPGGDEKAMLMNQGMQDSLQKMNRMFSLLSNITQALHDTQKALINNIRV